MINNIKAILAFILGVILAVYSKPLGEQNTYITLEQKKNIEQQIEKTRKEIDELTALKYEYEKNLNEYEDAINKEDKFIRELMQEELDYFKKLSGYTNATGEGITVTIRDSELEIEEGQNPNDLIVHDIDILRIINDLKKAGAEAISINGERVTPLTPIKCSGATITVNDTVYGHPFIIKAIGDVDSLMAAIINPQSYAEMLKYGYGIYIDVKVEDIITINNVKI